VSCAGKAADLTSVRLRFGLRRAHHLGENGAVLAHILTLSYTPKSYAKRSAETKGSFLGSFYPEQHSDARLKAHRPGHRR
jgi:hypothetical protein